MHQAAPLPHSGSGVIVDRLGHIVTHADVVRGASRIVVVLARQDRRYRFAATLVALDDRRGLALLRTPARSAWAIPWSDGPGPPDATACGWPLVALTGERRHLREMSACDGRMADDRLDFPLGPGYEGGLVADRAGRGVAVIGRVMDARLRRRAVCVAASEVRRFLSGHGVTASQRPAGAGPPSAAIRLARLQFSVVQVECEPARRVAVGLPALVRTNHMPVADVADAWFARSGDGWRLHVSAWSAPDVSRAIRTEPLRIPGITVAPTGADAREPLRPAAPRYVRDRLGSVIETGGDGRRRDLAAVNGLRGFHVRARLQLSDDGAWLAVGDAVIWAETGTVLWRTDVNAGDAVALSADGCLLAHAPATRAGLVTIWRLPRPADAPAATP
jgi:hypothetical protein